MTSCLRGGITSAVARSPTQPVSWPDYHGAGVSLLSLCISIFSVRLSLPEVISVTIWRALRAEVRIAGNGVQRQYSRAPLSVQQLAETRPAAVMDPYDSMDP